MWHNLTKDKDCFDIEGSWDSEDIASDSVAATVQARQHRSHILADARVATVEHRAELAERRAEKAEAQLAALLQTKAATLDSMTAITTDAVAKSDAVGGINRQLLDQAGVSTIGAAPSTSSATAAVGSCPACPPCDDCPPCPVSYCDWEDEEPCTFPGQLSKTFSWEGTYSNRSRIASSLLNLSSGH
eukprot:COSAG02_NODE_14205_length_1297_cov_1.447412_1_plen_187_part_00